MQTPTPQRQEAGVLCLGSWIQPQRSTDLHFLSPMSYIIQSYVRGLSPVLCLINKTWLCACSLTSPASRCAPHTHL